MSTRDVNLYKSFHEWFLANIDADTARTLRDHGASHRIAGLSEYSETVALFSAFRSEICCIAIEPHSRELWKFASWCRAGCMTTLANALVWAAAEQLAHSLKLIFDVMEAKDAEQKSDEGDGNEI